MLSFNKIHDQQYPCNLVLCFMAPESATDDSLFVSNHLICYKAFGQSVANLHGLFCRYQPHHSLITYLD